MPRFTSENARAMGSKGGRATVERHGRAHMSRLGVRGFWTTVVRHWDGDARAYVNYLISLGLAATDAVPQNGAIEHRREVLKVRAKHGTMQRLHPHWRPRNRPPDGLEPPF